ncbi:MAG: NifB/NifX family molybdenum-iron cluster-binding protein [Candidatus Cloacimonetes bacterium]|nr:NifB/NifX family molybdenum-iron cluster-binding protein [Candidatus Cloacimonadota bacterium]
MIIVFTAKGTDWDSPMDPRFGRTEYFFIYDEEKESVETFDNRAIANESHGAGPKTVQKMAKYKADILITGNGPGGNAASVVRQVGTKVFVGAGNMTVKEAYEAYKNNQLREF